MVATKPVQSLMFLNNVPNLCDDTSFPGPTKYMSIVGSLQYFSLTSPDITFLMNKLSQFMHHPTSTHWSCVKRLLRYLVGTMVHGLFLHKKSPINLHAYSNVEWARNPYVRSSTNAPIVFLGHNLVSWSSRKQKFIARSSTEAKYHVVASTASKVLWVNSLLSKLSVSNLSPPPISCDNVGATYLCANPMFHSP